jgi:hypothetical protein
MSTNASAGRVRATYDFIKTHRDRYDVRAMCRVLGVAPSGYYKWLQHPISNRAQEDARLLRLIRASFVASHGIYGAPRVFLDLRCRRCDTPRARAQRRTNGRAATTAAWHAHSLRSGHAVRLRRVAALLPLKSARAKYESEGQLLGQRRRRVILQQFEERADQETDLQEPRPGDRRRRGLPRYLLQSNSPPQSSRRFESGAIRSGPQAAPKESPLNPGNSIIRNYFSYRPILLLKTPASIGTLTRTSLISNVSLPFSHPNVHLNGILIPAPGTSR